MTVWVTYEDNDEGSSSPNEVFLTRELVIAKHGEPIEDDCGRSLTFKGFIALKFKGYIEATRINVQE